MSLLRGVVAVCFLGLAAVITDRKVPITLSQVEDKGMGVLRKKSGDEP